MRRRLLVPLGLAVTGLLALAAIASHGRPLRQGGAGSGPSAGFFDYVWTSIVIVSGLVVVLFVWSLLVARPSRSERRPGRNRTFATLAFLLAMGILIWLMNTHRFQHRLQQAIQRAHLQQPQSRQQGKLPKARKGTRSPQIRWEEVAIVLAFLAALGVMGFAARARRKPLPTGWLRSSQEAVSAALDESLDDLRADPDLRRAIVAAYARMERALAAAGLPRRPAEAPLEYVARALGELETSGPAASRLTDLFEWAKFSQHEPLPELRDEAVDALQAVRDELRQPVRVDA